MEPHVFDIQRFSIHDGPGIRTVVFLKGCNLKCPWCQNPESIGLRPEMAFYADRCENGLECLAACPEDAIVTGDVHRIDTVRCTACGKCAEACVSGALQLIGRAAEHHRVMEEVLRDRDYYRRSGGGVTFSGGEPTLHADFVLGLLKACKAEGIHTNIETNGYFSWAKVEPMLPYLDLIYFDIKTADPEAGRNMLGGDADRILENARRLHSLGAPVQFRIPLIPGHTATQANVHGIIAALQAIGIGKVHLLPYHSMGEAKADRICSPLPRLNEKPLTREHLDSIQHVFQEQGMETVLY